MTSSKRTGFTLIELLVVIAIIGILSSVVLASLSTARNKSKDAAVKAQVSSFRSQAESYYSSNNHYGTAAAAGAGAAGCTLANTVFRDTTGGAAIIDKLIADTASANVVCRSTTGGNGAWALSVQLPSDATKFFCADSSGAAKETAAAVTGTTC